MSTKVRKILSQNLFLESPKNIGYAVPEMIQWVGYAVPEMASSARGSARREAGQDTQPLSRPAGPIRARAWIKSIRYFAVCPPSRPSTMGSEVSYLSIYTYIHTYAENNARLLLRGVPPSVDEKTAHSS
jgi:hypothetical protein